LLIILLILGWWLNVWSYLLNACWFLNLSSIRKRISKGAEQILQCQQLWRVSKSTEQITLWQR
jgi:hypothetical protein